MTFDVDILFSYAPFLASIVAGILFFFSPCTIPLYSSYLSYMTGMTVNILRMKNRKWHVIRILLSHSCLFVLGVSSIFYISGWALGNFSIFLQSLWFEYSVILRVICGLIIILMGLAMLGLFYIKGFKVFEYQEMTKKPVGYLGSFLMGLGFAAGWTPCAIPMMVTVLALASQEPELSFWYITSFSLGFGLPFVIFSLFLSRLTFLTRYSSVIMKIGGALMVLFGILLLTDRIAYLIPQSV